MEQVGSGGVGKGKIEGEALDMQRGCDSVGGVEEVMPMVLKKG